MEFPVSALLSSYQFRIENGLKGGLLGRMEVASAVAVQMQLRQTALPRVWAPGIMPINWYICPDLLAYV
jgi:hypothetical protein